MKRTTGEIANLLSSERSPPIPPPGSNSPPHGRLGSFGKKVPDEISSAKLDPLEILNFSWKPRLVLSGCVRTHTSRKFFDFPKIPPNFTPLTLLQKEAFMGTKGGIGNDQNHTEDCHPGRMDDHGTPPPSKMGRDQLARAVVHHLYETALGGLDRMIDQNLHNWR